MMNTNRKALVQRILTQRAIIQHAVNQRAINQRAINQHAPLVKTENQINLVCVKNVEKTVYVPVDIPENIPEIVLNKI